MYSQFYARIPVGATAEMMASEFADKELRVIMSQNGVLINEFEAASGRYTEKTKLQKIESILAMQTKSCLAHPVSLQEQLDVQRTRAPPPAQVPAQVGRSSRAPRTQGEGLDLLLESQAQVNAAPTSMRLELASPAASEVKALNSAPASPLTEVSARTPVTKQEEADVLELLSSLVNIGAV